MKATQKLQQMQSGTGGRGNATVRGSGSMSVAAAASSVSTNNCKGTTVNPDQMAASEPFAPAPGKNHGTANRRDTAEFSGLPVATARASVDSSNTVGSSTQIHAQENEHNRDVSDVIDQGRSGTPEHDTEEDTETLVRQEIEMNEHSSSQHASDTVPVHSDRADSVSMSLVSSSTTPAVPGTATATVTSDARNENSDDITGSGTNTGTVCLVVPRILSRQERKCDFGMPTGSEFNTVRQLYKNSKVRGRLGFHVFEVGIHVVFDMQLRLAEAFGVPAIRIEAYFGASEAVQAWKEQTELQFVHLRRIPRSWSNAKLLELLGVDAQRVLIHRWRERRVCRLAFDVGAWHNVQQRVRVITERAGAARAHTHQQQEAVHSSSDINGSMSNVERQDTAGAGLEVVEWRFRAQTTEQVQERAAAAVAKRAARVTKMAARARGGNGVGATEKQRVVSVARASRGKETSAAPVDTRNIESAAKNGPGQRRAARATRKNDAGVQARSNSTRNVRPESGPNRQGGHISTGVVPEDSGSRMREQQLTATVQDAPIQVPTARRQYRHNRAAPVLEAATGTQEAPTCVAAAPVTSVETAGTSSNVEGRLQEALREVQRLTNMVGTLQQQLTQMMAWHQAAHEQAALHAGPIHQQQWQSVRQQSADSMSGMSWVPPMPPMAPMAFGTYGVPHLLPPHGHAHVHTYAPPPPPSHYLSQHAPVSTLVTRAAPASAAAARAP